MTGWEIILALVLVLSLAGNGWLAWRLRTERKGREADTLRFELSRTGYKPHDATIPLTTAGELTREQAEN